MKRVYLIAMVVVKGCCEGGSVLTVEGGIYMD